MERIYAAYEDLANAVIIQAVKDYRAACRKLKVNPKNRFAKEDIDEITEFFHSDFFTILTNLDGPSLLRKIIQDMEEKGGDAR